MKKITITLATSRWITDRASSLDEIGVAIDRCLRETGTTGCYSFTATVERQTPDELAGEP